MFDTDMTTYHLAILDTAVIIHTGAVCITTS